MANPNQAAALSQFKIKEATGIVVMSRVTDWTGTRIAKSAVSSINYYVYNLSTGASQPTLKSTGTCIVATAWSDSYSTTGWTADSVGFNVACPIPASAFTNLLVNVKGCKYQVEITGTPTSGDPFTIADLVIDAVDMLSRGS